MLANGVMIDSMGLGYTSLGMENATKGNYLKAPNKEKVFTIMSMETNTMENGSRTARMDMEFISMHVFFSFNSLFSSFRGKIRGLVDIRRKTWPWDLSLRLRGQIPWSMVEG